MTLDKAIEILRECASAYAPYSRSEVLKAYLLGIEGLKRHKANQAVMAFPEMHLLPGETAE